MSTRSALPNAATPTVGPDAPPATPGLRRRLAAMLYEGVLLFGVLMISGLLYGVITQQRHALQGTWGLQLFVFGVLGLYFSWFWSHGGQTVAMTTWHVRLVDARTTGPVTRRRALLRYVLSWLWFLPALLVAWAAGWHGGAALGLTLLVGIVLYALLALLLPERQFLHDRMAGTRLITWRPVRTAKR